MTEKIRKHPWPAALLALLLLVATALVAGPLAAPARAGSPIKRAEAFNAAATADTNLLAAALQPEAAYPAVAYRVTIAVSSTASVANLRVTSGATSINLALNSGVALEPGHLYTFAFGASRTYTYQLQLATTTTLAYLLVEEIRDGAL